MPFNPSTTIKYSIAEASEVELKVYDILRNLVETPVSLGQSAGVYSVDFNASTLASGIYFHRLKPLNSWILKNLFSLKNVFPFHKTKGTSIGCLFS